MKLKIFLSSLFFIAFMLTQSLAQGYCSNPKFEKTVHKHINNSVELISCDQLAFDYKNYLILDTRELEEYQISHLPGAKLVGYDRADFSILNGYPKDQPIVLYCSIGYRSEKIGERLQKLGYTEVHNLFGSIFEWANQGRIVVDSRDQSTNKIHSYNKRWSKWISNPAMSIIY